MVQGPGGPGHGGELRSMHAMQAAAPPARDVLAQELRFAQVA